MLGAPGCAFFLVFQRRPDVYLKYCMVLGAAGLGFLIANAIATHDWFTASFISVGLLLVEVFFAVELVIINGVMAKSQTRA